MKRHRVAALALCLCACSPQSAPEPLGTPLPPSIPARSQTPTRISNLPPTLATKLGSRLTIIRYATTTIDVNMLDVMDPISSSKQPRPGFRLVAVRAEISNPGGAPYQEHPYVGLRLVDQRGVWHAPDPSIAVDQQLQASIALDTGAFKRGLVPFEIPLSARITAFIFRPSSGTAAEAGEWKTR